MLNEPLWLWSRAMIRLGLVLLAVGLLPLLAVQYVFGGEGALVPVLLSLSAAPLGALCLLVGLILFLAALLRRRRESSASARVPSPPDPPPR